MKALLLLLFAVTSAFGQALTDAQLHTIDFEQKLGTQLPVDAALTDEGGTSGNFGRWLDGRPEILVFAYHECPNLCSVVLGSLVESLRNMRLTVGKDFGVIVVSIDPSETVAQAKQSKLRYAQRYGRYGSEQGWHFLTGSADAIHRITDAAGFRYQRDPRSGQYAHASGIYVLTPSGRISKCFPGIEFPPRQVQAALQTAGEERVGSLAQRLLLLCYHFSQITGPHGKVIQIAIRAAGVATVAGLVTGIVLMQRRRARPLV